MTDDFCSSLVASIKELLENKSNIFLVVASSRRVDFHRDISLELTSPNHFSFMISTSCFFPTWVSYLTSHKSYKSRRDLQKIGGGPRFSRRIES